MYRPDSKLVSLYHKLPIALQHTAVSAFGLRTRFQRYNHHYQRVFRDLMKSEWWNEDRIADEQNRRLSMITKVAAERVPMYRKICSDAQFDLLTSGVRMEDLSSLPIINKSILKNHVGNYHNNTIPKRRLIKVRTSGTSGEALDVYHTRESLANQWAVWARHKARFGIVQHRDNNLTFGARVPIKFKDGQGNGPFWRFNYPMRQTYLSTYHLSPDRMSEIVDYLNSTWFDYYVGYPSSMYILAEYMESNNLRLLRRPKAVFTGSDVLLPKYQKTIEKVFGARVSEQYGMVEACGNFSKCEFESFHLDFEFGIVEFADLDNQIESPFKKIVFTGLTNEAMPLIRYDTGDICIPSTKKCTCGRESILIEELSGRSDDFILTPDGRKIQGMNQVLEWIDDAREAQIIQHTIQHIDVNIVPSKSFDRNRSLDRVRLEFAKRLGSDVDINYTLVDKISKTSLGKVKGVISLLDQAF